MKTWLKTTLASVGILGSAMFALTGCGVKTDIKNNSSDILFNGGIVSVVGDHLVFSNGYKSDDISTIDNYNDFAKTTHLAAVNSSNIAEGKFKSPEGVKNLKSEVLGFKNGYTFVYSNSIYYAAPNKHKTSSNTHLFNYVSYFKCNFDGSGEKELFTTKSYDSAKAVVRALKYDGKGYLFVYDGTELNVVNLENSKTSLVSSKATSVAIPKEGEEWNGKVFYTEDKENTAGQAGNEVFSYSVKDGKITALKNSINNTVTFTGRIENKVFYSLKNESISVTKTMTANSNDYDSLTFASAAREYYSSEISNIISVTGNGSTGYDTILFTSSLSGSSQVLADNGNGDVSVVLANSEYSNVWFAHNGNVYYSTSNGISSKNNATNEVTTYVEGMQFVEDKFGYAFAESGNLSHIYFYAQIVYPEDDKTKDEDRDTNYYLFQVEVTGNHTISLVGQKK